MTSGTHYAGRPSPLYFAERLTEHLGGAKIYFKRDELNHTGAHKINNCLGQILLARRMGKTRIIAETGAGQHGVASATVGALRPPVRRLHGRDRCRAAEAERVPHEAARRGDRAGHLRHGHAEGRHERGAARLGHQCRRHVLLIGTAAGPHPYPEMVRDFQSVIGKETARTDDGAEGRLPDMLVACIGGGSNAIGLFHPFLDDEGVRSIGVEAGGQGLDGDEHAASLTGGAPGVLHGNRTYLLQDDDGQISTATRFRPVSTIPVSGRSMPG
jgi:tryptophan synthase beta chain